MLKNPNYDLVEELQEKSKGVWRYDQYLKDAGMDPNCQHCRDLWQKLKEEDERHIQMLKDEIKMHVQNNIFE
jgi:hypothetical protein